MWPPYMGSGHWDLVLEVVVDVVLISRISSGTGRGAVRAAALSTVCGGAGPRCGLRAPRAKATFKAYRTDWADFEGVCRTRASTLSRPPRWSSARTSPRKPRSGSDTLTRHRQRQEA